MGRHMHPEISMHTHCLGEYMEHIYRDDWRGVAELMLSSADKLSRSGADFLICPDNTIHHALPFVLPLSPLPWLHIVDEVAAVARERGFRKLAITGTKYTMEGTVYQTKLLDAGLEYLVPDADERARIDAVIFDELVNGIFSEESRDLLPAGDRQDESRGLRRGGAGLHGTPAADRRCHVAPADVGFNAHPRTGGAAKSSGVISAPLGRSRRLETPPAARACSSRAPAEEAASPLRGSGSACRTPAPSASR